jgi:hypothetical protein
MTRWLTSSVLVIGVILAFSGAAAAQIAQDLELNFFLAYSRHSDNNFETGFPQALTPIRGQFRLDHTLRGGVRANVFSSGHWGQEFFYSYEPNVVGLRRRTPPARRVDLPIQVHNLGVNALYYFDEDEEQITRLFASFGLGTSIYRPTDEARQIARDPFRGNLGDFDTSAELALNYGFGVKTRMRSRLGLRFDVRGFLGRNPSFGIPRQSDDPNVVVLPAGGAIHNLEVSAGIVVHLGRR